MLDTIGAREIGFGDDVPYREAAWEQVERGERPSGDNLAEAFFHLARVEEAGSRRDQHGRFMSSSSCLDPLDPPLERLRSTLGIPPPQWAGARFAVALTHDVDVPWRWTGIGVRGAAARLKGHVLAARAGPALREARSLAAVPVHKLRGTDPNWSFRTIARLERSRGAASTFFVLAAHRVPEDGPTPEFYARLRPAVVEAILSEHAEIGLHGSYGAADDASLLREEKAELERLTGPLSGHRFHYLRFDPHSNAAPLAELFRYDTSLGFPDAPGFRAGIAHPFRPWDLASESVLPLVEIPLAVMDATLAEERYLGLTATAAEQRVTALLDWAAANGGGFSVLWHPDRFDRWTAGGWDRLYARLIEGVNARGGVCISAGLLAEEAQAWLPT